MSIPKTLTILSVQICALIFLSVTAAHAQFSGSLSVGGYRSTNVEGRDSATPDNVFDPSIDLLYNWEIAGSAAMKFEGTISPNLFQEVTARSFTKSFLGASGYFYLSNIDEKPNRALLPALPLHDIPQTKTNTPAHADTSRPVLLIKPAPVDIPQAASVKLALLSEYLDSFDIEKKGLSADSIDAATDLKDSVSESVLALSDILAKELFTESIHQVVTTELHQQQIIFSQVPMSRIRKDEIEKRFDDILDILGGGAPQSDVLPMPKPSVTVETPLPTSEPSSPTQANEALSEALAHLAAESLGNLSERNAPMITLINSQTELKDFSTQDMLLKDDLNPLSKKTLATLLSVPVSFETQSNRGAYISYSYTQVEFKPRLDYYFTKSAGIGITYDLTNVKFPNDTAHLIDGTENKLKLDSRLELSSGLAFVPELGVAYKSFDHVIQYVAINPVKGRPLHSDTVKTTTAADYHHVFFGGAVIVFPSSSFSIGFVESLTRSSNLRPYLFDSVLTQKSIVGGAVTDDEYSYELTRESVFFLWSIFWDIRFSFDLSYENRHYANVEIKKRLPRQPTTSIQRDDHGPLFGLDLSKEFLFDSRLFSLFTSFTPTFDVQSMNYTSSVPQFNYKNLTATLSMEFGF